MLVLTILGAKAQYQDYTKFVNSPLFDKYCDFVHVFSGKSESENIYPHFSYPQDLEKIFNILATFLKKNLAKKLPEVILENRKVWTYDRLVKQIGFVVNFIYQGKDGTFKDRKNIIIKNVTPTHLECIEGEKFKTFLRQNVSGLQLHNICYICHVG
jgi:hypothetical protein